MKDIEISHIIPSDYDLIIKELNNWWGGRNMTDMLPRLFFNHFTKTSFIKRHKKEILGFIVGFVSQDNPEVGYVHFIGVNPKYRKQKIGQQLYKRFFDEVKTLNIKEVECVTSIENNLSINFHKRLGFTIKKGNKDLNGISYFENYDGNGEHRVVFRYVLK